MSKKKLLKNNCIFPKMPIWSTLTLLLCIDVYKLTEGPSHLLYALISLLWIGWCTMAVNIETVDPKEINR